MHFPRTTKPAGQAGGVAAASAPSRAKAGPPARTSFANRRRATRKTTQDVAVASLRSRDRSIARSSPSRSSLRCSCAAAGDESTRSDLRARALRLAVMVKRDLRDELVSVLASTLEDLERAHQ